MYKFIIGVIFLLGGDKFQTLAVPLWNPPTETITISMADNTVCDSGLTSSMATSQYNIAYTVANPAYGFTIEVNTNTLEYELNCDLSTLQGLGDSVTTFDVTVDAIDQSGSASKVFTIVLADRFAPVFANDPITVTLSICDLAAGTYSDGDVVKEVSVSDADPNDVVSLAITTANVPFSISGTSITVPTVSAVVDLLNNTNTPSPYEFTIQASDLQNKHTTDATVRISYDRNENCNTAGSGSGSGGGGSGDDGDDESGSINVFSYNIYILCALICVIRLVRGLE